MQPKTTSAERMTKLRDKRAREGLAEVRGVWWPAHEHAQFKALVKAAPMLLDALKALCQYAEHSHVANWLEEWNQARAAIQATEPAQKMRKEGKK